MALFQTSVLKKYLKAQDQNQIAKAYRKFSKYFLDPKIQENIKSSKEEEYQGIFLTELFVKVLDYTMKPNANYNLVAEYKNQTNSRKADGAILKGDTALGVIELKGTNTKHLEGIRQQAFDYKANQKACVYVITSNFEKLRFYINDATEFLEFDLFSLTEDRFALLYLCLQKENLLSNLPLEIKEASLVEESQITKGFYKDYSVFKRELYRDLVRNNAKTLKNLRHSELVSESHPTDQDALTSEIARLEKNVKLTLFKKSQKLIDRFLFIFFAEDRGLLPPNAILQIIEDWNKLKDLDVNQPLYERFKLYFSYLDTGRKGTDKKAEIFAYNGGLFKPDAILDLLEINDELLYKHTAKLSAYDFESQVDVNILGHIFENSLNEIESVNAEIEGDNFDKQKSKRKKDGVFYTPKYITKYIVENTVGKLCEEKKTELEFREEEYFEVKKGTRTATKKKLLATLDTYRDWLLQLTICDPACGSGAFLNQALEFLITEHAYIDELKAKVLGGAIVFSDIENTILENNIYGVDINEESVEIAKLSLWLRTAQPRRKLNDLSSNIKCGNSLIDAKSVAGDKAFKWEDEVPAVFTKGGFDVVIGNPPYVRAELLGEFLEYFEKKYNVYHSASDLFAYFYELGFKIIKEDGLVGFISNTFSKTAAGKTLRSYLTEKANFNIYIDFTEIQIFEGATTYPIIIIFEKSSSKNDNFTYIKIPKSSQNKVVNIDVENKIQVSQLNLDLNSWSFLSFEKSNILAKISYFPNLKQTFGKCYYGIKTALNDAFIVNNDWELSKHIRPILEGKEIKKWNVSKVEQKLILFKSKWTNKKYPNIENEEQKLKLLSQEFPLIFDHLNLYAQRAKKRYDKGDYWWELRNCAYYDLFEKPKIIFPNLQNSNKFCLDKKGVFINAPAVFLPSDNRALICLLNSKIVWEFLKSICVVRSGGYIEVKPQYFEQIPVPELKNQEEFEIYSEKIINAVDTLQKLESKFQNYLLSQFPIEKLSKKLQNWHELDFGEFIKELNKAINAANRERRKNEQEEIPKLTRKDEFEWMELFEDNKKKAVELQTQINQLDHQIDQMVYELYGLTEEEISIVENA